MPEPKLTAKQKKFIDEYLIDLNATQAAIRAGYSEKTAQQAGSRLLLNVVVSEEIKRRTQSVTEKAGLTQERVLLEIARLAFNDPRKVFNEHGDIKPIEEWEDEVAACISSVETTTTTDKNGNTDFTRKIKFWDKGKQLELAGRYFKLFTDKVEHEGNLKLDITKSLTNEDLEKELQKRGLPTKLFDE